MSDAHETAAAKPAPVDKSAHLAVQDLATLDVSQLNPLSPNVISRQATINVGMFCVTSAKVSLS